MTYKGQKNKIIFPEICYYCGAAMGNELKKINNENWINNFETMMKGKTLCLKCYNRIKSFLNDN